MGCSTLRCPTCKVFHNADEKSERKTILVTSSILHDIFLQPIVRLPFHIDIESICGANIKTLHYNWKQAYSKEVKPMDLIVVSGLNDVRYSSTAIFMNDVKNWECDVMSQNSENSFRICKLLRPPMFAWFKSNGEYPTPRYVNLLDRINEINSEIDRLNNLNGHMNVIGFQNDGCRAGNKKTRHRFEVWREINMGKQYCLHLKEEERAQMFKRLCRYIEKYIIT